MKKPKEEKGDESEKEEKLGEVTNSGRLMVAVLLAFIVFFFIYGLQT